MIDLSTIRILYRRPDDLALYGIPYLMRADVGQAPRDLIRGNGGRIPEAWIYLGHPGWWSHMPREDQAAVKAWLVGKDAPGNPGEWRVVDAAEEVTP